MKKYYLLLFFTFTILIVGTSQELNLLESYSIEEIEEQLAELGIPSVFFTPEYGVDFYSVVYNTVHPNGDTLTVSGAICLPNTFTCELPVATYQHGTVFSPDDVPSNLNDEAMLGVLFASKGFVVPMPDYIGLGINQNVVHPYIHADSEAQAGLDLLRVTRNLQEELGFTWNDQLFIFGYSQGGHAAAALQKKIETEFFDEFTVTASVPMSGPYDLSGAQTEMILSGEPYAAPGYLPYIILGYQSIYGNIYSELSDILQEEYAQLIQNYIDGNITLNQAEAGLPSTPADMLQPEFLQDFTSNPDNPLTLALQDNSLLNWAPVAPTRLIYCANDDQVSFQNSLNAIVAWAENGSTTTEIVNGGPFNHTSCVLPAMLNAYNFIQEMASLGTGIETEISTTNDVAGEGIGSAEIIVNTEQEFSILWEDGTEETTLNNLTAGNYSVQVILESGCFEEFQITIDQSASLVEVNSQQITYYPNPVTDFLKLEFVEQTGKYLEIKDTSGRSISTIDIDQNNTLELDFSSFETGLYFIHIPGYSTISIIKI